MNQIGGEEHAPQHVDDAQEGTYLLASRFLMGTRRDSFHGWDGTDDDATADDWFFKCYRSDVSECCRSCSCCRCCHLALERDSRRNQGVTANQRTSDDDEEDDDECCDIFALAANRVVHETRTCVSGLVTSVVEVVFRRGSNHNREDGDDDDDDDDDSMWSSPEIPDPQGTSPVRIQSRADHRRARRTAILLWSIAFICAYGTERTTFKVLIDRAGPFRLFSAEAIAASHATVLGGLMFTGAGAAFLHHNRDFEARGLVVPLSDLGWMALLDTVHLLLSVMSGSHVSPVATIILAQSVIPFIAVLSEVSERTGICFASDESKTATAGDDNASGAALSSTGLNSMNNDETTQITLLRSGNVNVGEDGNKRNPGVTATSDVAEGEQTGADIQGVAVAHESNCWESIVRWHSLVSREVMGASLILVAVVLCLGPSVASLLTPALIELADLGRGSIPDRVAWNNLLFVFSCIPAAASQLYKERTLGQLRQPVDTNRMNLVLSVLQFLATLVLSPFVYSLQGLGAGKGWGSLYLAKQTGSNFVHGLFCFLGHLEDEVAEDLYPESASCRHSLWVVLLMHVLAIILTGAAVERICQVGASSILHRCISLGIVLAFSMLFPYEVFSHIGAIRRHEGSTSADVAGDQYYFGPIMTGWYLLSATLLIWGSDIYHRSNLSEATFDTVYPASENLYDVED